jgi:hypothetical protein
MKRRIVIASVAVVILVVTAVLFVETTIESTSSYTNRVGCTDYEVTIIQASVITNASGAFQTFQTISATTSFTTTTNYSATVGHTTVNAIGPLAEFGTAEVNVTSSCTFVK